MTTSKASLAGRSSLAALLCGQLAGATGTGKTHLATAIGVAGIAEHGKRVRFYSTVDLVNPWLNIESARWLNIESAPTGRKS